MTPINYALSEGHETIFHILKKYEENPSQTRLMFIREYFPQIVEEYFILFVLLTDNYFIPTSCEESIERFFKIIINLPQELQALIAHLIIKSPGTIPRSTFIDYAVKKFFN
jgi:hypothetical protein